MTNFNFDNFIYARAPIPAGGEGGPLNAAEPLYASIPLLIEINRAPAGACAGPPYCYGLFLDNVSQSFFDLGDERLGRERRPLRLRRAVRRARLLRDGRRGRGRRSAPVHHA